MSATDRPAAKTDTPLLFGKRSPASPSITAQYGGTNTELDIKRAGSPG
jgi:hypothetical protein